MRKNRTITFGQWILIGIALILGFLGGKIIHVPGVYVSKELNPLHGISILFSLFIAIYISIIFAKYKENQKVQKELIFKRLDGLVECSNFIDTNIEKGFDCAKVNSILKKINIISSHICQLLNLIGVEKDKFDQTLAGAHRELRILMTHTPANHEGSNPQPVKCENGIYEYSKEQIQKIKVEILNIENATFQVQLDIAQK